MVKLVLNGTWNDVCRRALEYAEEVRQKYGLKLTLRALFYYLADAEGLIIHSQTAYKKLSEHFARYREKHKKIDVLEDRTREYKRYYECRLEDLKDYVRFNMNFISERLIEEAKVPRWLNQENYVAIWIEKEAITIIDQIAEELEVDAFPSRGFSSVTKMYEAVQILNSMRELGKNPIILVLTDFDPSGIFIEQDYKVKVKRYGGDAEFVRIAMNPDQIVRYDLPSIPHDDPKAERVRKDPRYPKFLEFCKSWGVDLNVVELDAFIGLELEKFRKLIISSIERYFDEEIYKEVKKIENRRMEEARKLKNEIERFIEKLR